MNKMNNKFMNRLDVVNAYYRMQIKLVNVPEDCFLIELTIKIFVEAEVKSVKMRTALRSFEQNGARKTLKLLILKIFKFNFNFHQYNFLKNCLYIQCGYQFTEQS